jgi:hypothetical protein
MPNRDPAMGTSERPGTPPFVDPGGGCWSGAWAEQETALGSADELILSLSARRECSTVPVTAELKAIDQHFDVDAVYLEDG